MNILGLISQLIGIKTLRLTQQLPKKKKKTHNKTIIRSEDFDLRITHGALFVIFGAKTLI